MKKLVRLLTRIIILLLVCVFGLSAMVAFGSMKDIAVTDTGSGITDEETDRCRSIEPQCIMVLGCAVWSQNTPSPMLRDRLDTAIELYKAGVAPKLLMTGDNSLESYNEPYCMLTYALEQGVPAEDIFLDYAGFSTYESIYRAHAVFDVDSMIVVTQKYHLFRALHSCKALGIEALGAASNQQKYTGRHFREAREVLARDKDFIKGILKLKPTFLGDEIPIDGDGTVTHGL